MGRILKDPRLQKGFQSDPDVATRIIGLTIIGAIVLAAFEFGGSWWQKLLLVPGLLAAWAAGLAIAAALIGGGAWFLFFGVELRRKAQLRKLSSLVRNGNYAEATALAESIIKTHSFSYGDVFKKAPELCSQFVELCRQDEPLRRPCLRIVMEYAPWTPELESAIFDGRDALESHDLSSWLRWFRYRKPNDHTQPTDRWAAVLEFALSRMDDTWKRHSAWRDYLPWVQNTDAWRRLAARYRTDLAQLPTAFQNLRESERTKITMLLEEDPGRAP